MILSKILFRLLIIGLVFSGCSKDDDNKSDDPENGMVGGAGGIQNQVGTKYPIYVGALAIGQSPSKSTSLTSSTDSGFRNRSIASGTPQEMQLTVVSMRLKTSESDSGVPIFLSDDGKILNVRSGYVDLTKLFTKIECLDEKGTVIPLESGQTCECGLDANKKPIQKVTTDPVTGETYPELRCPSVQPGQTPNVAASAVDQLGTYTHLSVRLKSKALMKGCVTGFFMYTKANTADDKSHTYCTQAAKSIYSDAKNSFLNSDFESIGGSKTPELMEISLDYGPNYQAQQFIDLNFPIAGGVTIDGVKSPQITLGIDLGRVLRFSGIFAEQPREPEGNQQSSGAHFFTLDPKTFQFVFVGKPGKVLGYQWTASAGVVNSAGEVPSNRTCVESGNDSCQKLAGWMTTIFEGDGNPIVVSLMPDDDNAFTVLKGSNLSNSGYDKTFFSKKSDNIYDVSYAIPSTTPQSLSGTVYAMDFSKAVSSVQELTFATKTMTNGKFSYGKVNFTRAL